MAGKQRELLDELHRAEGAHSKLHQDMVREGNVLLEAYSEKIAKKLARKHNKGIMTAYENVMAARYSYDTYVEMNPEVPDSLPVGTRVVHWDRWGLIGGGHRIEKSGRLGVVQLFNRGDDVPSNLRGSSIPKPGSVIIRLMNKGGEESKRVDANLYGWFPEGVEPNVTDEGGQG